MAGDKQEAPWPVPKFHFKVTLGDKGEAGFQEASGLDFEVELIEYRSGNSKDFSKVKMPGLKKFSDVTLKKGMFAKDDLLFKWISEDTKMNTIARQNVTIQLLDETGGVLFTWSLKNAFPLKVTSTDLNAQNSEAAVEEVVLSHEGLTMAKG